jgi:hypothetical protein
MVNELHLSGLSFWKSLLISGWLIEALVALVLLCI